MSDFVIRDIDLKIEKGEVFGFLGPNGAGKTTTQRVLLDVIRPTAGTAHMFGLDCQKEGVEARANVGYLPGELSLYESMKVSQGLPIIRLNARGKSSAELLEDLG